MKAIWAEDLCMEINDFKWCYTEMSIHEFEHVGPTASIRMYFREDAVITENVIKRVKKVARKWGFVFTSINFCPIEQTPYILLWQVD